MQLSGDFSKINFATLLNLSFNSKLNGKLTIQEGIEIAEVFLLDGMPVYATLGVLIGLDAILEIFLLQEANFFYEENNDIGGLNFPLIINMEPAGIIQSGVEYVKKRIFLNELGITVNSVLIPTSDAYNLLSQSSDNFLKFIIDRLNGINTIAKAFESLNLSLNELIDLLYKLINQKLVVTIEPNENSKSINLDTLPSWVIDKLLQDNSNINQAIIDLVVWADRAKAILVLLEKDLKMTIDELAKKLEMDNFEEDDFYTLLNQGSDEINASVQPLFGEFGLNQ